MAELVSAEEGIEIMRAPHVDWLYVGLRGSWAYRKQGTQRILIDGSLFCGWRSYPPPYERIETRELPDFGARASADQRRVGLNSVTGTTVTAHHPWGGVSER